MIYFLPSIVPVVAATLLWLWITNIALLLGAEIDSELERGRELEAGIPAARKSLHMVGKAADIRISSLSEEVLGGLIRSFRQGGVGYYYRSGPRGGWIHADTGLNRTWKG